MSVSKLECRKDTARVDPAALPAAQLAAQLAVQLAPSSRETRRAAAGGAEHHFFETLDFDQQCARYKDPACLRAVRGRRRRRKRETWIYDKRWQQRTIGHLGGNILEKWPHWIILFHFSGTHG